MNGLSRKLHELEANELDFPPKDEDILLHIGDDDELVLHHRATRIRESLKDDAQAIIDSGASVDQQNKSSRIPSKPQAVTNQLQILSTLGRINACPRH